VAHHKAGLCRALEQEKISSDKRDEILNCIDKDHSKAARNNSDKVMLDYALKLTRLPGSINAEDVSKLRSEGFSDRAIHDICSITAYFNFVNRIANGLGIEIEEDRK